MSHEPFLQKLTLRNFRSIRSETVTFANPLFLVGRNGSGKSNFVDALAFLSECMTDPLQSVIERRGGLGRVGHLQTPQENPHVSLRADFCSDGTQPASGFYSFDLRVTAVRERDVITDVRYTVYRERCKLDVGGASAWLDRNGSQVTSSVQGINFAASPSSLILPLVSGVRDFAPVHQLLSQMRVYHIETSRISGIQYQDAEPFLRGNGSNVVSILKHLSTQSGRLMRVSELLQTIVPGVAPLSADFKDGKSLLSFEQQWPDAKSVFEAASMSSGTLYALGLVVTALQEPAPSLIAIEEPELNIHPGALEAVADILNVAAQRTQVVVTTHSPDLLDTKWIQPESLRVVEWRDGETRVSELGEAPVKALRQHLMGAGELMRANALDAAALSTEDASDVFEEVPA